LFDGNVAPENYNFKRFLYIVYRFVVINKQPNIGLNCIIFMYSYMYICILSILTMM